MAGRIRSVAEARLLKCVDLKEFDALRAHRGDIIAVGGNTCYRLSWDVSRQTRFNMPGGLTGYARLAEAVKHDGGLLPDLPPGPVKVHFCAHCPCRGKCQGYTVEMPHVHLQALSVVDTGAKVDWKCLWRHVEPLGAVDAALQGSVALQDVSARREAQTSRLRVDCANHVQQAMIGLSQQWRRLGDPVGLFAFFTWAYCRGCPVTMHFAGPPVESVDVVEHCGSWAIDPAVMLTSSGCHVLACVVERVDEGQTDLRAGGDNVRQIRLVPRDGRANHYVPLLPRPAEVDAEPSHRPCDGTLCGGKKGDPCYALLCSQCAPWGMAPLACASDGNCAFDTMLAWEGGSRAGADIKRLRHELANTIVQRSGEDAWHAAFQLSGEQPVKEPPPVASDSPPRGKPPDTAATPPPRSRGMSPGVGTPQKTTRDKLLDKAIAWKLRVKRPPAYLLSLGLGCAWS